MSEQQKNRQDTFDQNVEMLEQILEVMPDDLVTLRALYETSVKMQKPEKAFETLTRLDDQARSVQNLDMIDFVLNQYESIADDSPEMQGRIARLQEIKLVADLMEDDAAETVPAPDIKQEGEGRLDAEMALAWDLFQDEQLSQDEYSNVLHDLTEMSSRQMGVPVTVLHVLHDRQFSRMERLMTHLSHKNKMPIMMLSLFEGNEESCRMLPLEFVCRNGVLPFEKVGDDLLVAVLNPMDQELVEKAQTLSGRHCHPYLVPPEEYDQQLAKLKQDAA